MKKSKLLRFLSIFVFVHLKSKSKVIFKYLKIHYNWQFLNCIRLWFAVVGAYPSKDDLGKLTHPLIEITNGILKFYPNVRYAPFRLHLIDYLNEFSYKSSFYITVVSYLLEIIQELNLVKKRNKSFTKKFDFVLNVKVQKEFLKAEQFYI